ncbi:hypothetical protein DdX_19460 [Ditylenchus destructor]|uniref:Uncharacterized protein n=1 Tax=Ditylenchus destructor TaxID=166010 RepID=A0AAD4MIC9_9BILA|nr:hypothetical protein DdX_19460 [Ditylenchus destructor]
MNRRQFSCGSNGTKQVVGYFAENRVISIPVTHTLAKKSRREHRRFPGFMASGNPENPGFGQVTDHASGLGSGRVIRRSLRLGELSRLVPVSLGTFASTGIYGFRKILDLVRGGGRGCIL